MALAVRDQERSLAFYAAVLGVVPVYPDSGFIQAQTPGARAVIVFERGARRAGRGGGVTHFGYRLIEPSDIAAARAAVEAAGGRVTDAGEFVPCEPYRFFEDADGYLVKIWYELPTPVDPPK
jgi:catechol 2,3-dioxygenase-like lactoylglutathione lyase family enzyme